MSILFLKTDLTETLNRKVPDLKQKVTLKPAPIKIELTEDALLKKALKADPLLHAQSVESFMKQYLAEVEVPLVAAATKLVNEVEGKDQKQATALVEAFTKECGKRAALLPAKVKEIVTKKMKKLAERAKEFSDYHENLVSTITKNAGVAVVSAGAAVMLAPTGLPLVVACYGIGKSLSTIVQSVARLHDSAEDALKKLESTTTDIAAAYKQGTPKDVAVNEIATGLWVALTSQQQSSLSLMKDQVTRFHQLSSGVEVQAHEAAKKLAEAEKALRKIDSDLIKPTRKMLEEFNKALNESPSPKIVDVVKLAVGRLAKLESFADKFEKTIQSCIVATSNLAGQAKEYRKVVKHHATLHAELSNKVPFWAKVAGEIIPVAVSAVTVFAGSPGNFAELGLAINVEVIGLMEAGKELDKECETLKKENKK